MNDQIQNREAIASRSDQQSQNQTTVKKGFQSQEEFNQFISEQNKQSKKLKRLAKRTKGFVYRFSILDEWHNIIWDIKHSDRFLFSELEPSNIAFIGAGLEHFPSQVEAELPMDNDEEKRKIVRYLCKFRKPSIKAMTPKQATIFAKTMLGVKLYNAKEYQNQYGTSALDRDKPNDPNVATITDWTPEAIFHLVNTLVELPASHRRAIGGLASRKNNVGSQKSSGGANMDSKEIELDYDDNHVGEQFSTNPQHLKNGVNRFDSMVIHETGHVVDAKFGLSKESSFLALSDWQKHYKPSMGPNQFANYLYDNIDQSTGDFPGLFSNDDFGEVLIKESAKVLLKEENADHDDIAMTCLRKLNDLSSGEARRLVEESHLEPEQLSQRLFNAPLLQNIEKGFAKKSPWKEGREVVLKTGRFIHQSYEKYWWYSFDPAKRGTIVSDYQFRCPEEEFAEIYSMYYGGKRQQLDNKRREWFDTHVNTR